MFKRSKLLSHVSIDKELVEVSKTNTRAPEVIPEPVSETAPAREIDFVKETKEREGVKEPMNPVYMFPVRPLANGYNVLRTAGLASANSATFGMVRRNKDGSARPHQGVDLAVPNNYKVYAVDDARVHSINHMDNGGYGKSITLKLNNGKFVFYGHLNSIRVRPGENIKAGHYIGLTGSTGNARSMKTMAQGAHLHFEVRTQPNPGLGLQGREDPLKYFPSLDEYNAELYK